MAEGYRNGYGKPRRLAMSSGTITLRRPRVRGVEERFESRVLPLFARRTKELGALLPELYLHGLAEGDFELAMRGLLGEGAPLSESSIRRPRAGWTAEFEEWSQRRLEGREVVYVWADGIYVKAGLERDKAALLVVLGAMRDGTKEVLALRSGYRESVESWSEVLRDLKARGIEAPRLLMADGNAAIWGAVRQVWPEAGEQRCWNHKMRNVLDRLPDAVAGVANFLTRGDFEGMEMTASHEYFAGASDTNVGGIWGRRLGSSTNAVVSAEWMTRQQLTPQERDWALHPYISGAGAWSWTGNPGAFLMPSLTGSESSGELISQLEGAHFSDDDIFIDPRCLEFGGFQESYTCRFRYQPWDNLLEQSNYFRAFAEINGELGDNSSYHIEGLWAEAVTAWVTTPSFPPIKPYDGLQIVPAENPGRQAFCQQHGSTVGFMSSAHCLEDDWYFFGRLVGHSGPGRTLERKSRTQRLSASWDGGVEVLEGHDNRLNLALSYSRSSGNVNQPAEYAYRKYLAFRGYGGRDCGVDVVADPSSSSGIPWVLRAIGTR